MKAAVSPASGSTADSDPTTVLAALFSATLAFVSAMSVGALLVGAAAKMKSLATRLSGAMFCSVMVSPLPKSIRVFGPCSVAWDWMSARL